MATLQEIEKAVSNFTPKELAKFRTWFEKFDAALWDKQLADDVKAGKLGAIADKAISDFKKGKFKDL